MKKPILTLTIILAAAALVAGFCSPATAAVKGICSNCHTMHYSQGGTQLSTWGTVGPYTTLLTNDCLGCHTTTGNVPYANGYPYVKGSGFDNDTCLAGGFFQPTAVPGDNNSNENHDIGATAAPAGFDGVETTWYTGTSDGLSCAGTNGCHGNQTDLDDMVAIKGGHHAPTAYRILYVGTDPVDCVDGPGTRDYEMALNDTPSSGEYYNVYSAHRDDDVTISELCAKCHGDFHGESGNTTDVGVAGAWIRHPTDNLIPTTWGIYTTVTIDDRKWNPPGYATPTEGVAPTGTPRATCISCHRAHGTAENDLLRFNYATQLAGQTSSTVGCLGCHDKQR
ncbi:MAG: hypothetical protein JRJ79_15125 [Deltaproteobacteria bacterium]|nr:hypothetical protein [Deltaproteobacteria bacterium]MBW1795820.1 hypothetical protein [Deltaproteobacteria bacterium]